MASYPIEIRRCQHIKMSGRQCGSPAVKDQEWCYYHQQNRTTAAELYLDGERYADGQIMIPPFEDAHAIQMVLRHIVKLMLQRRIDRKDAGLALYALQIASGNLKQMQAEKPRPTQMVREPEKVGETPMGMTPWSASGKGHDPEEEGGEDAADDGDASDGAEDSVEVVPPSPLAEMTASMDPTERFQLRMELVDSGMIREEEIEAWRSGGPDPLVPGLEREAVCIRQRKCAKVEEHEAGGEGIKGTAGEVVAGTVGEVGAGRAAGA